MTHEALVGVDFFEYQGRRYTSLSSVARGDLPRFLAPLLA
jgi:hypothetical protein